MAGSCIEAVCADAGTTRRRGPRDKTQLVTRRNLADNLFAMLLGIDPALHAEILYVLRAMGHGDELVICDANFPAQSTAAQTVHGEVLRMENLSAAQAVRAILSVLPLDTFVDTPAHRMEVVGEPETWPEVQQEVQAEINAAARRTAQRDEWPMGALERFAFYERVKSAYAVVVTGERRFYGCFVLTKGVIAPEGA